MSSSTFESSTLKYALAGLGAVAVGYAVYYLSRESDEQYGLDPEKHTRERLEILLEQSLLEYTCIICRNYNLMLKVRDSPGYTMTQEDFNQLRSIVDQEIDGKTRQLCEDYDFNLDPRVGPAASTEDGDKKNAPKKDPLSVETLQLWIKRYEGESFVKKSQSEMARLLDDFFVRQKIDHISYQSELGDFTKEKYLKIYDKIWACIRHEMYNEILKFKKQDRVEKLSAERFKEIYDDVHGRFESIRKSVYELIMDCSDEESSKARAIMQKGFITFTTVSNVTTEDGPAVRSRWADQVASISKKHSSYMDDMENGKMYSGIETDPMLTTQADSKYDLKTIAGYTSGLSKQKTMAHQGL